MLINFNSHAHVERDFCYTFHFFSIDYFNSHAHVERDNIIKIVLMKLTISTHTLTWSVTILQIFASFNNILYFNSHAHVERDLYLPFYSM